MNLDMDKFEIKISDELINRLFSQSYEDLSDDEQKEVLTELSQETYNSYYQTINSIRAAKEDIKLSDGLRQRVLSDYQAKFGQTKRSSKNQWLKVAAIALLVLTNIILMNYYLGNGHTLEPKVRGADSGVHSGQKDSIRVKEGDTGRMLKRDTVIATISYNPNSGSGLKHIIHQVSWLIHSVKKRELWVEAFLKSNERIV